MAAASLIASAIGIVGGRVAVDDSILRRYRLSKQDLELFNVDRRLADTTFLSRLDGFLGEDGDIKFVESNPDPGGSPDNQALTSLFEELPIMTKVKREFSLRAPPSIQQERHKACLKLRQDHGTKSRPFIVQFYQRGDFETMRLLQYGSASLCGVEDPSDLTYRDDAVYLGRRRVNFVNGIDLQQLKEVAPNHPLLRSILSGSTKMLSGIAGYILRGSRVTFALMSDEENASWFPPRVREAVVRHVPWTRQVVESKTSAHGSVVDLVPYVHKNRERLVLKNCRSWGGGGVVLGWRVRLHEWKAHVARALAGDFIVQERVHQPRELYPLILNERLTTRLYYHDLNPFVWNRSRASGAMVRLSGNDMLNMSTGGSQVPVFIVSD